MVDRVLADAAKAGHGQFAAEVWVQSLKELIVKTLGLCRITADMEVGKGGRRCLQAGVNFPLPTSGREKLSSLAWALEVVLDIMQGGFGAHGSLDTFFEARDHEHTYFADKFAIYRRVSLSV